MSVVRIIYLFDYENFGKRITPALNSLKNGSFDELQKLANEIARDYPEVWALMDDLAYFPSDLGDEEESFNKKITRVVFWITLIICNYCSQVEDVTKSEPTAEVLDRLGVNQNIIAALIWGKPISDLLRSLTVLDDGAKDYLSGELGFRIGWLSTEDIENMRAEIQAYQKQNNHPDYQGLLNILDTAIKSKKGLILSAMP